MNVECTTKILKYDWNAPKTIHHSMTEIIWASQNEARWSVFAVKKAAILNALLSLCGDVFCESEAVRIHTSSHRFQARAWRRALTLILFSFGIAGGQLAGRGLMTQTKRGNTNDNNKRWTGRKTALWPGSVHSPPRMWLCALSNLNTCVICVPVCVCVRDWSDWSSDCFRRGCHTIKHSFYFTEPQGSMKSQSRKLTSAYFPLTCMNNTFTVHKKKAFFVYQVPPLLVFWLWNNTN